MRHEYYSYTRDELVEKNPKLPVIIMEDNAAVFKSMAVEMAEEIKAHNDKGEKTVFICPVGPVGQYPFFVEIVNKEHISLKNVWFINMDEYLDDEKKWIPETHPLSFRGFMNREVYGKINEELLMPEEQRIFPDPENVTHIPEIIEKLGGVDICFGGIGINGHVAFNEADPSMSGEEDVYKRQVRQSWFYYGSSRFCCGYGESVAVSYAGRREWRGSLCSGLSDLHLFGGNSYDYCRSYHWAYRGKRRIRKL